MTAEITGISFFMIFEILLILSSIRIQYLIFKKIRKNIEGSELVITWIAIDLMLIIIIATIFSFLQFNGIIQYLIGSISVFIILHFDKKSNLISYYRYIGSKLTNISNKFFSWKILVMFFLILPLIISIIQPLENYDSLRFMNYIFDWSSNNTTPYDRAWSYVPIWELSYLPSFVISDSDNFFWLNSLKSLIIIGVGTYLIGKQLGISKDLASLVAYTGILFFIFWQIEVDPIMIGWGGSEHIGALKNNHFYASGIILITFSIIRTIKTNFDRLSGVLLILGIIFITTRYFGLLLAIVTIILFILFNRHKILHAKKKTIFFGIIGLFLISATTGHYYLNNYIEYDNPFSIAQIDFLVFEFPGKSDWSGTSVASHLNEDRLWKILFLMSEIPKAGILFPIILAFGFLGTVGIISYLFSNYIQKRKLEASIMFLAVFILLNWMFYAYTPLTAGHGGITYIETFTSLRFSEATLILTELFFIYFLYRIGVPEKVLLVIVGINLVSRYLLMYSQLPNYLDYFILIYPIIIVLGIKFFLPYLKTKPRMILFPVLLFLVLVYSPYIYDDHRKNGWAEGYYNVIQEIDDLQPSEIYLVGPYNEVPGNNKYLFSGNNFQHTITVFTEYQFFKKLDQEKIRLAEYVIKYCFHAREGCINALPVFESKVTPYGYTTEAIDTSVVLLKIKSEYQN